MFLHKTHTKITHNADHTDAHARCGHCSYYQDYLVQIYGKKIRKKIPAIFSQNRKGIVWRKKNGRNGSGHT